MPGKRRRHSAARPWALAVNWVQPASRQVVQDRTVASLGLVAVILARLQVVAVRWGMLPARVEQAA